MRGKLRDRVSLPNAFVEALLTFEFQNSHPIIHLLGARLSRFCICFVMSRSQKIGIDFKRKRQNGCATVSRHGPHCTR
jgi:hypothetical protein